MEDLKLARKEHAGLQHAVLANALISLGPQVDCSIQIVQAPQLADYSLWQSQLHGSVWGLVQWSATFSRDDLAHKLMTYLSMCSMRLRSVLVCERALGRVGHCVRHSGVSRWSTTAI